MEPHQTHDNPCITHGPKTEIFETENKHFSGMAKNCISFAALSGNPQISSCKMILIAGIVLLGL